MVQAPHSKVPSAEDQWIFKTYIYREHTKQQHSPATGMCASDPLASALPPALRMGSLLPNVRLLQLSLPS